MPEEPLPEPDKLIYRELVRCPACESTDVRTTRSEPRESDGSRTRWVRCRSCTWPFRIVFE